MVSKLAVRMLVGVGLCALLSQVARADTMAAIDRSLRQFGRGVGNLVSSPFEIPGNIYDVKEEEGDLAGATYGTVRGLWRGVTRAGVGVFEVVTCPLGLKPIIEPEFPLQGGPVTDIFEPATRYSVAPVSTWEVRRIESAKPLEEKERDEARRAAKKAEKERAASEAAKAAAAAKAAEEAAAYIE
ncbi:MAG: hypothetical protein BWZ02_01406 [Lentisphaerae bacterium ADurb.BinA184]|nr:MAG: hypothetical protein BWZ02_01406 [Lentisphaerae bacterium ADurb.BinA184]